MTFQKGHSKIEGSGIQKGQKHTITLLREERRAIFEEEASKKWLDTIEKLPPVYIADQFMGKAPDTNVNINLDATSTERTRELGDRLIGLFRRGNRPSV